MTENIKLQDKANPIFVLLPEKIRRLFVTDRWWTQLSFVLEAFKELNSLDALDLSSIIKNSDYLVLLPKGLEAGIYTEGRTITTLDTKIYPWCSFFGSVIIGPNCKVGPGATIYGPTIIESDVIIGPNVEIRRSILFSAVKISHMAYIGHSIVGRNVNIGANLITAVRNLKRKTVHLKIGKLLYDTGERHFGAIIADNVEFGINVSIMPGRIISSHNPIPANSIIMKNIVNDRRGRD